MDIRFYISDYYISKYYKFLVLHFSNGESYICPILKSNGHIVCFYNRNYFRLLYDIGYFNTVPFGV